MAFSPNVAFSFANVCKRLFSNPERKENSNVSVGASVGCCSRGGMGGVVVVYGELRCERLQVQLGEEKEERCEEVGHLVVNGGLVKTGSIVCFFFQS